MAGRGGNDIASGVTCILERILVDIHGIQKFILWFDSCVPQNRNSYMSASLREFILKHPEITIIEQKFCEPGHSSIQEVDNIHSQIDRALSPAEIFSPLGLLRFLPNVNRKNPFVVVQMQPQQIKRFNQIADLMNYKKVPYFSVKTLVYRKDHPNIVFYKKSFSEGYQNAKVFKAPKTRNEPKKKTSIPIAKTLNADFSMSDLKKKDIQSMYSYMPAGADLDIVKA
jgi:hypothetical protein